MDPLNQNPSNPVVPPSAAPLPSPGAGHRKIGPIIAILTIVLILIAAAIYLFVTRMNSQSDQSAGMTSAPLETTNPNAPRTDSSNANQSVKPVTNDSDDLQSIDADLTNSTSGVDSQNF